MNIYNILGISMLVWYSCFRWKLLGNTIGKIIITDEHATLFVLNWWFVPINMLTAFISIYFLARSLFIFSKSFTDNMLIIGMLLLLRNAWYTAEDIRDYITTPNFRQLFFIIIDIIMFIYCALWLYFYSKN